MVVLEKTLESPLDCKEIQPVHPKGNQSWILIRKSDAEAETPILWPPDVKNWLIWKDPDSGKDWRREEKTTTEDEMVQWHHWLSGHWSWWWTGRPGVLQSMGSQSQTQLSYWTELNLKNILLQKPKWIKTICVPDPFFLASSKTKDTHVGMTFSSLRALALFLGSMCSFLTNKVLWKWHEFPDSCYVLR